MTLEEVPCETCGQPTASTGTKRCDSCWEVESRLKPYLNWGGDKARDFVEKALLKSRGGVESKYTFRLASFEYGGDADSDEAQLGLIERELLESIHKAGGSTGVHRNVWPVAEKLATKGFIRLGPENGEWRKAEIV